MENAPAAPPVRRKLFANRPSWAKEASCSDESETAQPELFGRKPNLEVPQRPSQKQNTPKQKKILNEAQTRQYLERSPKRRRVSQEFSPGSQSGTDLYQQDEEGLWEHDRVSLSSDVESLHNDKETEFRQPPVEPDGNVAPLTKISPHKVAEVVDIDNSDEEEAKGHVPQHVPDQIPEDLHASHIEPPFDYDAMHQAPELAQISDKGVLEDRNATRSSSSPEPWIQQRAPAGSQSDSMPDAIVKILIHSQIPNTNPLIIQRKLSQRLKECRVAWCAKQGLNEEQISEVFLTWRGRRLFDLTTCKSLGITVNEDGDAVIKGQSQPLIAENAQLEMEAVTQAILEENKKLKEQEETARQSEVLAAASPQKEKPTGIRIILKAKDYEEYKLIVRPTTKFAQIVKTFKKMRNVPEDASLLLMFDGERLAEDQAMSDSDIVDMDTVEVYVK